MSKEPKPFRPMKTVNEALDFGDVKYPKLGSIKFDGVYGLVKDNKLLGRSLKPLKNKWLTEQLSQPEFNGMVFEILNARIDGKEGLHLNRQDLYNNSNSCTGTIEKEDWDVVLVLFDYIDNCDPDYLSNKFIHRMERLNELLSLLSDRNYITAHNICGIQYHEYMIRGITLLIPMPHDLEGPEEARELYESIVSEGHEGLILRCPEGIFKCGRATKKSQEMVRFKPSGDSEIIVTRMEEMMENQNEAKKNELGYTERSSHQENKVPLGMVGALIGIDINSGVEVKIGAGKLTHEQRKEVWENRGDYIGRLAKYKFMDTGQKDLPRHPRWVGWRELTDVDSEVVSFAKEHDVYIKE
ncbi:DNA ligase [Acinetobacter phage vB_AbaM_phiAbaA1]|uniref:DNA ligase n=1 Tax=Acinetobacter phage vB_AbaM_phiAbaA1 TaxID=1605379 RepID=UPI00078D3D95|nr:DNA ligase [Acinetobacter phage vB_AbaM_phiAbaA1]AJK27202.1 DNA ligase [Acinetobacter phage vB_AbaM_phiAbaA1]